MKAAGGEASKGSTHSRAVLEFVVEIIKERNSPKAQIKLNQMRAKGARV